MSPNPSLLLSVLLVGCTGDASEQSAPAPSDAPAAPAPGEGAPPAGPSADEPSADEPSADEPVRQNPHASATPGAAITIPVGAMGVLAASGQDLAVWFPAEELPGFDPRNAVPGTYTLADQLVVFGTKGIQARFNPPDLQLTQWCEDEKGKVYRLQARIIMPAPPPPELMLSKEEGILSFVLVGDPPPAEVKAPMGTTSIGTGDLNSDAKPDALLVTSPPEEGCPKGNLDLVTPRGPAPLRCCR